jgi:hypothetical protein
VRTDTEVSAEAKLIPETVWSEPPVCGPLAAERFVTTGASYVNAAVLLPTFNATVSTSVAAAPAPREADAQVTLVSVDHTVVAHTNALRTAVAVGSVLPKLPPLTVSSVEPDVAPLRANRVSESTGASNESAPKSVPYVDVSTTEGSAIPRPGDRLQVTRVADVHAAVEHATPPMKDVAVRTGVPKLRPLMVISCPDVVGALYPTEYDTTGAS